MIALVVIEKSEAVVAGITVIVKLFVAVYSPANNPIVNVYVPAVVGVPKIIPALERSNPSGKLPLSTYHTHELAAIPESFDSATLYASPLTAGFSQSVVIVIPEIITSSKLFVIITSPVHSPTVNENVPDSAGVPEITPPLRERLNPAGNAPLSTYHTRFSAGASVASAWLYACPVVPGVSELVVIE